MYAAQHADACYKRFGKSYYEVHHFLDQYAEQFSGFVHRKILHHRLGLEIVMRHLGESARDPAELHIRQDYDGHLPEDWSEFREQRDLPDDEEKERQERILRELYGNEVYERVNQKIAEAIKSNPIRNPSSADRG